MEPVADGGLRERKKRQTHDQLQRIATRMFLERGYQNVTIEEIVAAANVSPRTFYRYFVAKEDLVLGDFAEVLEVLEAALAARPENESVLDSIRAATAELMTQQAGDTEESLIRSQIVAEEPSLQERNLERQPLIEAVLVPFVARRLGLDADNELLPRLVAATAMAAARSAVFTWTQRNSAEPLTDAIDRALRLLETGLGTALATSEVESHP